MRQNKWGILAGVILLMVGLMVPGRVLGKGEQCPCGGASPNCTPCQQRDKYCMKDSPGPATDPQCEGGGGDACTAANPSTYTACYPTIPPVSNVRCRCCQFGSVLAPGGQFEVNAKQCEGGDKNPADPCGAGNVRLQTVVDYKKFENSRYCIYSHDVCRTNYCCTVTVATAPTLVMPDNGGYSTKNVTLYWSAPTSWGETCANPKRYDVWLRAVDKNGVQVMAWTLKASNLPETTTQYSFVGTTGLRDCLIYSKRAQIALLINKVRRAEALPQFVEVR